jgi:hypothetical protein
VCLAWREANKSKAEAKAKAIATGASSGGK